MDLPSELPAQTQPPKTYRHLAPGSYRFEVRAVGAAGTDRTPAQRRFHF